MRHLNSAMGTSQLGNIGALQIERYKLDRLRQSASPATVNRELALLKHMFNLAEQWRLFFGRNPVKGVKFLQEDNLQIRSLSEAEEEKLLKCCSPYLQDLVKFAINTGLRLGEILNLKWKEVDQENAVIKMLVRKNRRMLEVPLNDTALAVVNGWRGLRKCEYVFYNPETGERAAGPFVSFGDDAVRAHEPRCEKAGGRVARREWCQFGDTAGSAEENRVVTLPATDREIR